MRQLSSEALKHPERRALRTFFALIPSGMKTWFCKTMMCFLLLFIFVYFVWFGVIRSGRIYNIDISLDSGLIFQLTISSSWSLLSTGIELTALKQKKNGKWVNFENGVNPNTELSSTSHLQYLETGPKLELNRVEIVGYDWLCNYRHTYIHTYIHT